MVKFTDRQGDELTIEGEMHSYPDGSFPTLVFHTPAKGAAMPIEDVRFCIGILQRWVARFDTPLHPASKTNFSSSEI